MLIPRRCTITITICNSYNASQSHSQEMHSRIQTQEITRKDQPIKVHGQHKTVCQKRKWIGNPNTDCENLQ